MDESPNLKSVPDLLAGCRVSLTTSSCEYISTISFWQILGQEWLTADS